MRSMTDCGAALKWRIAFALAAGLLGLPALLGPPAIAASRPGPYFSARLEVRTNSYTFGQTPSWSQGGGVLSNEADHSGSEQVYASRLDGSRRRCLTCGRLAGPNGFPQQRPDGDWILFCSMGDQPEHWGAPCLGGYGSDLFVMRRDGTQLTRLTRHSDPANGARYDNRPGGVPYDNYHAYWSPDGRHIVWTRTEAHPLAHGGQRWQMMLAEFVVPAHQRPHLAHVRVVGPAFGVYETQPWAPDGSGFLFTAFGPRRSPFQSTPPGWMHLELYFMRLFGPGASPEPPLVTHLTGNDPAYEEQAVFTPDMRDVIVMSSRARHGTWYQTVITAAQWLNFDAPDAGSAGAPMFLADFTDPDFTSDLYMVDVETGAVRRLTSFHHIIPEFLWNRDYTKLLWSEAVPARKPSARKRFITRVAGFAGVTPRQRRRPRLEPAPGLAGQRIDMARVRIPSAAPRLPASSAKPPPPFPSGAAVAAVARKPGLPPVVLSYYALLLQELHDLASRLADAIPRPPV